MPDLFFTLGTPAATSATLAQWLEYFLADYGALASASFTRC
jgi:hypothetical protein